MRLRFGAFVFDSRLRTLTRDGEPVDLSPKAFSLVEALIEARPAPVNKNDLYERLWPKTFVVEGNLHTLISDIRTALGDSDHTIIRTVHGFGYAFAGDELPAPADARYAIVVGKDIVQLHAGDNIIGRDPEGAVVIDLPEVSRQHACVKVGTQGVTVEDLGSKNGTFIAGQRISERYPLHDGAEIVIGRTRLLLRFLGNRKKTITLPM
jgi:DNA-binding winged helix-turn-helix (wHTH) protein